MLWFCRLGSYLWYFNHVIRWSKENPTLLSDNLNKRSCWEDFSPKELWLKMWILVEKYFVPVENDGQGLWMLRVASSLATPSLALSAITFRPALTSNDEPSRFSSGVCFGHLEVGGGWNQHTLVWPLCLYGGWPCQGIRYIHQFFH